MAKAARKTRKPKSGQAKSAPAKKAPAQPAPNVRRITGKSVYAGQRISLKVQATSPTEKISYEIVDGQGGATIDESTGEFDWTPNAKNLGKNRFTVRATDGDGFSTERSFNIMVNNMADPTISPISNQSAPIGIPFSLQVVANDPDGGMLMYELTETVDGLTIDSSGLISGSPQTLGFGTVEVKVSNMSGEASTSFQLNVTNSPPDVDPIGPQSTIVGAPFSLQVSANDPEGHMMMFSLEQTINGLNITSSGEIVGTPQEAGVSMITVKVTDAFDAFTTVSFQLTVNNTPPVITPIGNQTGQVGMPFSLQVEATDPDGHPLFYSFKNPVPDLMIDSTGNISGTPQTAGTQFVEVVVTDMFGAASDVSFNLAVSP